VKQVGLTVACGFVVKSSKLGSLDYTRLALTDVGGDHDQRTTVKRSEGVNETGS